MTIPAHSNFPQELSRETTQMIKNIMMKKLFLNNGNEIIIAHILPYFQQKSPF